MSFKRVLFSLAVASGIVGVMCSANATVVATIDGCYDCSTGINGNPYNGGDVGYDTPMLTIHNTSGGDLVGGSFLLQGYQGSNNGISQTVSLPTIGSGLDVNIVWSTGTNTPGFIFLNGPFDVNGITARGSLTAYDYDDSYGAVYNQVGNFSVTFSATISGGVFNLSPVFSIFSPNSNNTGGFVGWEGLDPNGYAETVYDAHSGTVGGTLALIEIGTPGTTPLPAALPLFATGLGALGLLGWRRKRKAAAAIAA